MTAPTMTPEAASYLSAVDLELADLPADERAELLEDLGMHLLALADEGDHRSLEARLGSAQAYAEELRAAAGLPPRGRPKTRVAQQLGLASSRLLAHPTVRVVRGFLPELRPAWWVLRGYLAVEVLTLMQHGAGRYHFFLTARSREDFPLPAPLGSHWVGALLVVVAMVGSVKLGRARLPRAVAFTVIGLNLALVFGTLSLAELANGRLHAPTNRIYLTRAIPGPLTAWNRPITNIFPFAADGTPLRDVLLYDQDGRPVKTGFQEWWADHCRRVLAQPKAADGVPVPQSFPQQYILDPSGKTTDGVPVVAGQCRIIAPPKVILPIFGKKPA